MADPILYPYPLDLRWNHIEWFPLFFRRLTGSDFWLCADLDVKGAAMGLFAASMEATPPATIPMDHAMIVRRMGVTDAQWADLLARPLQPLHGWRPVQCGGEVRLTHPVMLEGLEIAVSAARLRQRGTSRREMWSPPDAGRAPR